MKGRVKGRDSQAGLLENSPNWLLVRNRILEWTQGNVGAGQNCSECVGGLGSPLLSGGSCENECPLSEGPNSLPFFSLSSRR